MSATIKFNSTFEYKLIYVFRINDGQHTGCLKIGDATIHTNKKYNELTPNCQDLNFAARERIDYYTATAGIVYELLYTEVAIFYSDKKKMVQAFRDHKVHSVLKRSGIKVKIFETNKVQNEWFVTDLETAKKAILAVKNNQTALTPNDISSDNNPIIFRPEQLDAIKRTIKRYRTNDRMLWNAKMRFGKTLTALQVAKEMGLQKTIIITHRPVVSKGWFEDFNKIFYDKPEYAFGSKTEGKTINDLLKNNTHFVYFASMQDLRGSDKVGGNFDKNDNIFKTNWDFVVVDEAHEGTKTDLGKNVLEAVIKEDSKHKTHVLELSGTPFNLLTDFEQESIYTWDYIMEQEAKTTWDKYHFGDSNPYAELPKMNIFTYHLEKNLPVYVDVEDKAFNFREFFRLWTGDIKKDLKPIPSSAHKGEFVHQDDVKAFLDLICRKDENTNYPFSTNEYRNFFRHSLWVVPGVKEAKALAELLRKHHIFSHFKIVNVAGEGDEEIDTKDALSALHKAMTDKPYETYTITLSCGRLTTGVSVPEWTSVLMLAGTYSTVASQYLQTIFRVQTPANIDGKMKEECYVFDFAPDRTLKMVAESAQLSARGGGNPIAEIALGMFLNFCPVIAISESNMKEYKVSELLQELKKAYAERVARNGFDDPKIYNDELLKLTDVELNEFEELKKIVGASKQTKKAGEIDINKEGFDEEEIEKEIKDIEKKKGKELTEEEKQKLAELKQKKKNRDSAISILRAISIRMPLLVYGMNVDIDKDVTIDNFADLMTDEGPNPNASWEEFMPKGVTKEVFKTFSKYYDKDIFVAASRRIRYIAKTADELDPLERVKKISSLFATFKNPDKETVLTPWRVVNMHLSQTIGGWDFFDENHESTIDEPRFVKIDEVTNNIFNESSNILEINSKTGLYPLYIAYSLFRVKIKDKQLSYDEQIKFWDEVIEKQVFVICKTPMAKQITKRTLLGYRKGKVNMHAFDDLIMQLKDKMDKFVEKVSVKSFWNVKGAGNMKFNAIVGNPPYQGESDNTRKPSIYPLFYDAAFNLSDVVTLISPARFLFNVGDTSKEWNYKILNDEHFKVIKYFPNSQDVFNTVEIKGGVVITLRDSNIDYGKIVTFTKSSEMQDILVKVNQLASKSIMEVISSRGIYRFTDAFFKDYPNASEKLGKGTGSMMASNVFNCIPEVFLDEQPSIGAIRIIGLDGKKRIWKWIDRKYIQTNEFLDKYNVVLSKVNGKGKFGEVLTKPFIIRNGEAATDTFISIGCFNSLEEAENLKKYIMTKFVRAMLGIKKVTQDNPKHFWEYVPLESFKKESDIDWNKSIADIDKQLYLKYELSNEQVSFIEKNVQKME